MKVRKWILPCLLLASGPLLFAQAPTLDQCDERVRVSPGDPAAYYCFVTAASASGRFEEAAARLEEIRRLHPDRQRAVLCLAAIRQHQGKPETEPLYRDAIRENHAAGDAWGEVYARSGLGQWYVDQGRTDAAEEVLEPAYALSKTLGDPTMPANILVRLAAVAYARLDYGRALQIYRKAESAVFPDGPAYLRSWVLSGFGSVYWAMGEYRKALSAYEREAELARLQGDLFTAASIRWNMSLMATALQSRHEMSEPEVRKWLDEALEAAILGKNRETEARCRTALGQLLEGSEAMEQFHRALSLTENQETIFLTRRQMARAVFDQGPDRREEGMRILESTIADARAAGSLFDIARGEVMRAFFARASLPEDEAVKISLHALDAVETIRARQEEDRIRAHVFSQWGYAYHSFVDWLLCSARSSDRRDRYCALAFSVMERMRARVLMERLSAAGVTMPEPVAQELSAVRQSLGPDRMILSYQIWERGEGARPGQDPAGGSWLLAITEDDVRLIELPGAYALEQQVSIFQGIVERRDGYERNAAGRLYKELLQEALEGPGRSVRHLLIVPDGPLHSLPFSALRASADSPSLSETYLLSFEPSIAAWERWNKSEDPVPLGTGVLSMADPAVPGKEAASGDPTRSNPNGSLYGPLPFARREAKELSRRFGAGTFLTGSEARESRLKGADLSSFSVLHFATHILIDSEQPKRSGILLAGDDGDEDGWLRIDEVSNLDLSGPLIILSGCRSAAGSIVDGEGVMGLAHAFFLAGARTVIGSLWPLRDDEAAEMIEQISRGIAGGLSVAEALVQAQRHAMAEGMAADGWAGLVVLGDGDLRIEPPAIPAAFRDRSTALLVLLLVLGTIAAAWAIRRFRSGRHRS